MEQKGKCLVQVSLFIFLFSSVINTLSDQEPVLDKQHFVLVHGAGHGAWCWYKLVALLKSSGHTVTALDLNIGGTSISDYMQPLMDFMTALPSSERVILVGHSFGGVVISQAMESFPEKISVAVFVTAMMLGPSLNISSFNQELSTWEDSLLDSRYIYNDGPNNPPTTLILGPSYLAKRMYQQSLIEDFILATSLVTSVQLYSEKDISNEVMLSNEKYGSVSRVFIISNEDLALKKGLQLWMIEKNLPDSVEVITGSDHMVMISKPKELWAHLLGIAKKYSQFDLF